MRRQMKKCLIRKLAIKPFRVFFNKSCTKNVFEYSTIEKIYRLLISEKRRVSLIHTCKSV